MVLEEKKSVLGEEVASSENEEYNEEEDEDFDPSKVTEEGEDLKDDGEDNDEEAYVDDKELEKTNNYASIESESGGLVKTRRARQVENELKRKRKYEELQVTSIPESINKVWEELNDAGRKRLSTTDSTGRKIGSSSVLAGNEEGLTNANEPEDKDTDNQILIERTYKFAGETIKEKKYVSKFSAEGQEYLNNLKFQEQKKETTTTKRQTTEVEDSGVDRTKSNIPDGIKLRRPLKRPPILEQIISGALKPKLTTLEKSKLDWASYVDKEGINDELRLFNKDGYLAKQDFLNRVETKKDQQYKELRQKQLQMQLNDTQNG
ncbi:hypothetical protein NCAS_0H01330 [Naumovozyma castellii]|uniref:SWR1-complex protein 5 n=1 Tax=Naumovozyma castellii TaxID=27288 RepID=G0VIW6_NAUCA|nr:hypothetical protein NCAS_0H01330 [Naumovozyma castellii CBS 4309]CCC71443.1 hypothetical protein NCAS_0H01330 [Naumovozyma castellii CBS 4309]